MRCSLDDLAEITPGPSGSLMDKLGSVLDGVPVVTPSDIAEDHRVDTRNLRKLPTEQAAELSRFKLRAGDILLVRQGTLGKLALVDHILEGSLYNSSCARIRCHPGTVSPQYLVLYLSSSPVQAGLANRALPGTVHSINASMMRDLSVVVPPLSRQLELVDIVSTIDALASVHRQTASRLDALKPALIAETLEVE